MTLGSAYEYTATLRSDPPLGKRGSAPSAKDALRDHQPTEVSLGYASASTKVHVPNILRITRDSPTKVNNSTLEVAHLDEATIVVQQWHLARRSGKRHQFQLPHFHGQVCVHRTLIESTGVWFTSSSRQYVFSYLVGVQVHSPIHQRCLHYSQKNSSTLSIRQRPPARTPTCDKFEVTRLQTRSRPVYTLIVLH